MNFIFFCVIALTFAAAEEWIQTPHGLRPKECVIKHNESNVVIDKVDNGLMLHYPISNRTIFYKSSEKCTKNAKDIIANYRKRFTDNDPMDGWEIYAHYGQSNLGRFDSVNIVPNQNLPATRQLLYYFIGLTNFDNNETIIQPVIAFCGSSSCGYSYAYSGWQMAAWNCCPNGLSNYGQGVKLSPGEVVQTYVQSQPTTGNIQVYMKANGGTSQLNENGDYRAFNDAEIAGEFYSYSNCNQFNSLPIQFAQNVLRDTSGNVVNVPISKWQIINRNPLNCGGSINFVNTSYATITATK